MMKLRFAWSSPFVRKTWVTVHELGLADRIERIATNPTKREDVVSSPNPLGKVPCLETDDGLVLYDSIVICESLDHLAGGGLFPPPGPARWTALRRHALANGMLDSTVLRIVEGMRKEERRSQPWINHQIAATTRALDALEAEAAAGALAGPLTIGHITIGVSLAFLGHRFPDDDWPAARPQLAEWFAGFNARPSMLATDFVTAPKAEAEAG